ncbi:hypothetical protein Dimus_024816 [Dionaea muscipula]
MAASSCQYTTDRPRVALASTTEDTITNNLQLDDITQLSSQIETFNRNFANLNLVATVNSSRTSCGGNHLKEQCPAEEQPLYLEPSNHDEEAVNYANPQWDDNNNQRWN